jgi:FSR family fosmidomycin resistance protein-like MFS transporter
VSRRFKKAEVLTISFAHMAHDIFSSFLAPLLPLLIEKLGMSLSMAAFLNILTRIPSLFNPFFGMLAERTGAKYFVILAPAVTAISMSLLGLADSYGLLFILLIIAGISTALFHVPSPTMIKEAAGDRIGTGMSFFMVGGELARTIGPLLVIAAVSWWGLEGIYRLMPIGLLTSVVLFVKLRDFDLHRPLTKPVEKGDTKKVLKKYRLFFIAIGLYILFQAGMKSALTLYLPVYLTGQGGSLWVAGISLSILQFFGVLGTFSSGSISDRIGRIKTLILSSTGAVVMMGFFIYTGSILALALLGLFLFAANPVLMAIVQDTDSNMPTFMNSMYMSINFGMSAIVVFAVGFLGDEVGLSTTYLIFNIVAIGMIPAALLLRKAAR